MIFRIVWLRSAINDVFRHWAAANPIDRNEIRAAVEDLRTALQANPLEAGESRYGSRRIVFRWPLFAIYDVDVDRGIVWVAIVGRLHGSSH